MDLLVRTVNINDVLSGRGNGPNNHSGNIFFREIVAGKRDYYSRATKKEKKKVIEEIVRLIVSNEGRFLSEIDDNGLRRVLDWKESKKKTAQALREKTRGNNDESGDRIVSAQQEITLATDYNPQEQHRNNYTNNGEISSSQQDIDIHPTTSSRFDKSFDWETLKNGNDNSTNDGIVDALMASRACMGVDSISGLQSRYQDNENESMSMREVTTKSKVHVQDPELINQKLPFMLNKSRPHSDEKQEAVYKNQDTFNTSMTTSLSSSHIPLNIKLTKASVQSWISQNEDDEDVSNEDVSNEDVSNEGVSNIEGVSDEDKADGTRETNRLHEANIHQPSSTSIALDKFDHNHLLNMSLASLFDPNEISENQKEACSNQNRFAVKKSILQRKLFSSNGEDNGSDKSTSTDKHNISANNDIHEANIDQSWSSSVAPNQPTQNCIYATCNDTKEMSLSSLLSINEYANLKQSMVASELSVSSNASDSDFYFDDDLTDKDNGDRSHESYSSSMRDMMTKFKSISNRQLEISSLSNSDSDFYFDDDLTDRSRERYSSDMREIMTKIKSLSNRQLEI